MERVARDSLNAEFLCFLVEMPNWRKEDRFKAVARETRQQIQQDALCACNNIGVIVMNDSNRLH